MKIATWNVNSLQVRLPHVLSWLAVHQPDVLALQETKMQDVNFPVDALKQAGYQVIYSGEKSYNGVALLTKSIAQEVISSLPNFSDAQCRFLAATVNQFRIVNLYVPNGSAVGSEKYTYKLAWLDSLIRYVKRAKDDYPHLVLLGDFNIAPLDEDVHDPQAWAGHVLVSEPEREKWRELLATGLVDAFRLHHQGAGQFSWWDYRMNAFKRNHGLRIDHILISQGLVPSCKAVEMDKLPRTWERPSDHVPVMAQFS